MNEIGGIFTGEFNLINLTIFNYSLIIKMHG